jgi:hypothetical protein
MGKWLQKLCLKKQISHKHYSTYQIGGKHMQDMDYTLEWFHHFVLVSSKFSEVPCLLLKDGGDGLDRIATFELPSERMFDQSHSCLCFIVMQSSLETCLEERLKRKARWVTHTVSPRVEEIWL